jgi:hypothetical protein
VTDTYGALKGSLVRRLAGRRNTLTRLDAVETGSSTWDTELAAELTVAGAIDAHVLEMANRLLALTEDARGQADKYQVHLPGAQGVQVGDNNTQHNTFH